MKRILEYTLRGYGQMFLCNNPVTGVFFLAGLTIASPMNALWSFIGGAIVTLLAFWLARPQSLVKSGLFGVNGVLLGCVWGYFPEVTEAARGIATVLGAVLIALVLVPATQWMKTRKSPFVLFSVPYVLAAWTCLGVLSWFGQTDARLAAGWKALAEKHFDIARQNFFDANPDGVRARALRDDGLAWCAFQSGNYTLASESFRDALLRDDTLDDAFDGLGWSSYRLGMMDAAQTSFECAVTENRWLADSWDGLGWLALQSGKLKSADECFYEAVLRAPLFSDAWNGLAVTRKLQNRDAALLMRDEMMQAKAPRSVGEWLKQNIAPRFQFTSLRVLLCWLLFLLGIARHSLTSAAFALAAVVTCLAGAHFAPGYANVFQDIHFVYNLTGIFIACGGLYLRLSILTVPELCGITTTLVLVWARYADALSISGFPPLCLPFNIALVGGIALFLALKRCRIKDQVVPLDWASSGSPETVRLWMMKRDIAQQCWAKLDSA